MRVKLTPRSLTILAGVIVFAVAVLSWPLIVSPQKSHVAKLDQQIADAQTKLLRSRALVRAQHARKAQARQLRTIARAMPANLNIPAVIHQLSRTAKLSGVTLDGITAQPLAALNGYRAAPLDVTVSGRYFEVESFLGRLRSLVQLGRRHLHATGRLYGVDGITLGQGEADLPRITTTVHLKVFAYDPSAQTDSAQASPSASPSVTQGGAS
jgi:type IV pilus assembly protein PilO